MSGEEVLLRGLYELCSGAEQHDMSTVFGRDGSAQSRAFTYFINHMYEHFQDIVTNNLEWWYEKGFLYKSMCAIKEKIGGNDNFNTCAFIDCNCLECDRPAGGPAEEGTDASRWDPSIQKAFYNGWKSVHGLKHQTMDCAYGMTVDLFGPTSLRKNDLSLLRQSDLNRKLRNLQIGIARQLTIYGDSIYPRLSHLKSSWRHIDATADQKAENKAYTKVRVSIEWNYGATGNLYGYLRNHNKLKLLGSATLYCLYTTS
jgi:hypothetical protein